MRVLRHRLARHRVIGLDSMIFIYQVENHPLYQPMTHAVLNDVQRGTLRGVTSAVTLMELTVHPWRAGYGAVAREYEALLVNFPNLTIVDVTRDVARRAAQLRAAYGIGPTDAIQAAAALAQRATAFVTNDLGLRRLEPILEVVILDDFIAQG